MQTKLLPWQKRDIRFRTSGVTIMCVYLFQMLHWVVRTWSVYLPAINVTATFNHVIIVYFMVTNVQFFQVVFSNYA